MSEQSVKIMINGKMQAEHTVMDRGFQYGDGLFETMLVIDGEIPLWDKHSQRLTKGCQRLSIAVPDLIQIKTDISKLAVHAQKAVLKLIVTRGESARGYAVSENMMPQVILILNVAPDYPQRYWTEGVKARMCDLKIAHQPLLAGIKHLNRLEQVMARNEWNNTDIVEGIVCDQNNHVIEGIMSNIFIVKDNHVLTPDLGQCGVEGVMRNTVIELLERENIEYKITDIQQEQLFSADEVFLTNSILGIWPVQKIDDSVYNVGTITRHLQNSL